MVHGAALSPRGLKGQARIGFKVFYRTAEAQRTDAWEAGIREHFQKALATKRFDGKDVRAGREHVKAYVEFVHYAEEIYASVHEHSQKSASPDQHH